MCRLLTSLSLLVFIGAGIFFSSQATAGLMAGAAAIDVTPTVFPVLINGSMLQHSASRATSKLHARALALDDGTQQLVIVVVDSCALPRELIDEAKQLAFKQTNIPTNHITIAATHTHTAPSSLSALGTGVDPQYPTFLRIKLVEAITAAQRNLEPAQIGWGVGDAGEFTALRRWIHRPDRMDKDPFGNLTVRANMHSARDWNKVTGVSGPEDPDLSLISVQAIDGRPIAVLANFSMHYFAGVSPVNADYYGMFCEGLRKRLETSDAGSPAFVGIMSHGCSGDVWRRDYSLPSDQQKNDISIDEYTEELLTIAISVCSNIEYQHDVTLGMAETRFTLPLRVPDAQRLQWAQNIVEELGDQPPKTTTQVYAQEQIHLHEKQASEIVVQAIRIGEIGIATTPTETYALTGLKIKLQSPLRNTMVFDLANGAEGYIPPPEQHLLGGYNTWAARSAGLEIMAEPKIAQAALHLLEKVAGETRHVYLQSQGATCTAQLTARPRAYWRLDEFAGTMAADLTEHARHAYYEPGVVFFLDGPRSDLFCQDGEMNRAAHFAGGRLRTQVRKLDNQYSVSLWFWNGMPSDAREVTGWMFSRDRNHNLTAYGDHLGIGGTANQPGVLIYQHGPDLSDSVAMGTTPISRWTWNHALLVRDGNRVRVFLNHHDHPEIDTTIQGNIPEQFDELFFGGRSDNQANWEGRLDEIAVFDRVVTPAELQPK
ncbi:MAG: hypothetical protein MK179_01555 [Pirellulaceae bacterium]|nr:hypothetical protein [Pirellulaceae bacterium]